MFELFVSYNRRDNLPPRPGEAGRISDLVSALQTAFLRQFGCKPPIFFDKSDIGTMDDWRHRILGGIRESKILIVFLSPAYFESPYCRLEWEAFRESRWGRLSPDENILPISISPNPFGVGEHEEGRRPWREDLLRRQYLDLSHSIAVQGTMDSLMETVRRLESHLALARKIETAPGNVERHNPHFVGRREELRKLKEFLALERPGRAAMIQGLGGTGKSALANEYAHAYAGLYGGGRWLLHCEGEDDLQALVGSLNIPLKIELDGIEKQSIEARFRRVLNEMEKRAAGSSSNCLLILDNVDRSNFLSVERMAMLPRAPWLHILGTTRLPAAELQDLDKDIAFLPLDELPDADAVALIRSRRTGESFEEADESAAASEIVKLLGGFTLAVEVVSVHLGLHAGISCRAFLTRLVSEGWKVPDALALDAAIADRVRHRQKLLSRILADTLALLTPHELLLVEYGSRLPADNIPSWWLRFLVAREFQELAKDPLPGYPHPLQQLEDRCLGLRIILASGEPAVFRMHRLVQEIIGDLAEPRRAGQEAMIVHLLHYRLDEISKSNYDPRMLWELESLTAFLEREMGREPTSSRASLLNRVGNLFRQLGYYSKALPMLEIALAFAATSKEADLPGYHNDLAALYTQLDRKAEAESQHLAALALLGDEQGRKRGLSCLNLAVLYREWKRPHEAEPRYLEGIRLLELALGSEDPDVATARNNYGKFLEDMGRSYEAESIFKRVLDIRVKRLGPEHISVGNICCNLGTFYLHKRKWEKSEAFLLRAYRIKNKTLSPLHPDFGELCSWLATLYDNRIRSPEAEPFHRQAIAAYVGYRKANGTRHRYFEAAVNAYRACLEKCGNSEVQIEAKISEATA